MTSDPQANASSKKSGPPRWLLLTLVASLAINLLFIGFLAGSWWRHGGPPGGGPRSRMVIHAIENLMPELSQEKRSHAADLIRKHRDQRKPNRQEMRAARKAAKEAVLSEPFDEAKVNAALSRFRELRLGQHEALHGMLFSIMQKLDLEERRRLVAEIEKSFRKHRRGRPKRY